MNHIQPQQKSRFSICLFLPLSFDNWIIVKYIAILFHSNKRTFSLLLILHSFKPNMSKKIYKVEQRDGINKFNLFNMLINFRTPHKFDIYQQWSEITQELNIFGLRNFIQKPYSCLFTRGEWFLPSDFSYKSAKSNKQQKKLWRRDKTGSLLMHPAKSFFCRDEWKEMFRMRRVCRFHSGH